MSRKLFGKEIDYKDVDGFDADDIWWTGDGKAIPIIYMSERHLKNAIEYLEGRIGSLTGRFYAWCESEILIEYEEELERLLQEERRRKLEKVFVIEVGNPYYE